MDTSLAVLPARPAPERGLAPLQIFSTCPSSSTAPDRYLHHIGEVARWSEDAGCTGILIYTDNSLVLNTSFNVKGQPIVNTPQEAIHTFLGTGIECLFLEDTLLCRRSEMAPKNCGLLEETFAIMR